MMKAAHGTFYLVNGACPFIVMDMAEKCNVHPVLLPKLLQAHPSHGIFKCATLGIPISGGISKSTMRSKDQPWLFPSIY
jgi:hypothetical protein